MMLVLTKTLQYEDGSTYHLRAEGQTLVENNTIKHIVSYTVNGCAFTDGTPNIHEYFAVRALWYHHRYADSLTTAVQNTLYIVENCLDTHQFRRWYQAADTPEKRVNRIMDTLHENRDLVISAYASAWQPEIKIELWREDFETLHDRIAQWIDGVEIIWTIRERTLFTGIIVASAQDTAA